MSSGCSDRRLAATSRVFDSRPSPHWVPSRGAGAAALGAVLVVTACGIWLQAASNAAPATMPVANLKRRER